MKYLISYDLMKPGQNHDRINERLEGLGAVKVLRTVWVIERYGTTVEKLRGMIDDCIDLNDRLLIARFNDVNSYRTLTRIDDL